MIGLPLVCTHNLFMEVSTRTSEIRDKTPHVAGKGERCGARNVVWGNRKGSFDCVSNTTGLVGNWRDTKTLKQFEQPGEGRRKIPFRPCFFLGGGRNVLILLCTFSKECVLSRSLLRCFWLRGSSLVYWSFRKSREIVRVHRNTYCANSWKRIETPQGSSSEDYRSAANSVRFFFSSFAIFTMMLSSNFFFL